MQTFVIVRSKWDNLKQGHCWDAEYTEYFFLYALP